jgi:5,10-methylenetetrahydromethanopterin reductase
VRISCALLTTVDTPDLVVEAERLGYSRAWLYDSPALTSDVWMALALAASRTSVIGIGPAVLVPSLRHPMTNAAAMATLAALAPGRVAMAIGAGFTARYAMGQKPLRWAEVERYVVALQGLLRGETVEWYDALIRMLHSPGFVTDRPVDVELLIASNGPKGTAVARRVGAGLLAVARPNAQAAGNYQALLQYGTVLGPGEDVRSPRVLEAAGHAVALSFHAMFERGGPDAVARLPGGAIWLAAIDAVPPAERHLVIHEGHLIRPTAVDEKAVFEGADHLRSATLTGSPAELRDKVAAFEASGVDELLYQPAGPDPAGELARMMAALSG